MSFLISIDPGSRKLGYAIFDTSNKKPVLVEYNTIHLTKIEGITGTPSIYLRIKLIVQFMDQVLNKFRCDTIAIEEAFLGKNPKSAMIMSMARGAILASCAIRDMEVYEYAAKKIKQIAVNNASATKDEVMRTMELVYNIKEVTEDAADAIAIGTTHLALANSILSKAERTNAKNPTGTLSQGTYRKAPTNTRSGGRKSSNKTRSAYEHLLKERDQLN